MNLIETEIAGIIIIEPRVFEDGRGYFFETYNEKIWAEAGLDTRFVQDNESSSTYGTIRGLHRQVGEYAQAKLVRAVSGCVLDVAVDLRKDSPTYGRHVAVELSGENKRQVFIPRGCAHGFSVLSESATFVYKCDNFYAPRAESGVRCDDLALGIDWRISHEKRILSEKDLQLPLLADLC